MTSVSGALGTGRSTGGPPKAANWFRCLTRRHRVIAHVVPLAPRPLLGIHGSPWPVRPVAFRRCAGAVQERAGALVQPVLCRSFLAHHLLRPQLRGPLLRHRGANEYLGELYLQTGDLAKAKERLEKLDDICFFGCGEYNDLKAAIEAYKSGKVSG